MGAAFSERIEAGGLLCKTCQKISRKYCEKISIEYNFQIKTDGYFCSCQTDFTLPDDTKLTPEDRECLIELIKVYKVDD